MRILTAIVNFTHLYEEKFNKKSFYSYSNCKLTTTTIIISNNFKRTVFRAAFLNTNDENLSISLI